MARPPKPKQNPILIAVSSWLDSLPPALIESLTDQLTTTSSTNDRKQHLLDGAPKRWVVYEPMVLLPNGSFTAQPWPALLESLTPAYKDSLWISILSSIPSKPPLTHLAINEGIPLYLSQNEESPSKQEKENLLRAPTALHPLHGSFGPATFSHPTPSQPDFDSALWVSTKQNGILQTWAPRWTMFSRGNVKEKARLLSFHKSARPSCTATPSSPPPPPPWSRRMGVNVKGKWAVDLYAGIGYFAFSYARLGMRVLCWELNPWSAEGLRRGALANGFSVRIVSRGPDDEGGGEIDVGEVLSGDEQIVVFLEDNRHAVRRIAQAREKGVVGLEVVHVNCGFLPTSEPVWRDSWKIQSGGGIDTEGWLHLHENVGVEDIERRKGEVQELFDRWKEQDEDEERETVVEHVELVKTYAPGVWHCVFDVFITRSSGVR
ncbi:hypothetical protein VTI74DRAFT_6127 [Chaetomium olivicolor]